MGAQAPSRLKMTCNGCGNEKAHWIRRRDNWEICDACAADLPAPSTGRTVDRFLAYKSRNSLNPPIIPTLPQPAMEHYRVMKKLEAKGQLRGKQLQEQRAMQAKLRRADTLRAQGLAEDGRRTLGEVNDNDNLHALPDGSIENDAGKKIDSHRWEVVENSKQPVEMKEVQVQKR